MNMVYSFIFVEFASNFAPTPIKIRENGWFAVSRHHHHHQEAGIQKMIDI